LTNGRKSYLRVFRGISKTNLPGYVGFFQFLRNFRQQNAFEQAEVILQAALDVHFISSLPVMQRLAWKAWAEKRPVQIVWTVRSTRPDHDVVDDAFG
jgi:hypothetical protein